MERRDLIAILRVGLQAASPYNAQPWEFQFKDGCLLIFVKYAFLGKLIASFSDGILYSLGTLLENLSEGARHLQYEMTYRLGNNDKVICEVWFKKIPNAKDYSVDHVMARYTNRKIYRRDPVPASILTQARTFFNGETQEILDITNDHESIRNFSLLERIRIANIGFNDEMIEMMCFTAQDAEKRRRGLDLRVLEVPFHTQLFLQAARNRFFRRTIGRSFIAQRVAEKAHEKLLYGCPLLLLFKENVLSPESLVHDWMRIQKIMNFLRQQGLNSQLVASGVDLLKIVRTQFSASEKNILNFTEKNISKHLGINPLSILTLLRVGYAEECKTRSLRLEPEDVLLPE